MSVPQGRHSSTLLGASGSAGENSGVLSHVSNPSLKVGVLPDRDESKADGFIFSLWRASFNLDFLIHGKKRNNCYLPDIFRLLSYVKL